VRWRTTGRKCDADPGGNRLPQHRQHSMGGEGDPRTHRQAGENLRAADHLSGAGGPARQERDRHHSAGGAHRDERSGAQRSRRQSRARPPATEVPESRHNAINEAFRIAEDQLAEYKRQLDDHGREPFHEVESQALGQVADIDPDGDFGFIVTTPAACCIFTATVCSRASSTSSSAATRCTTRVPAQELRRARRGDLFVEHREHASYTKA